MLSYLKTFLLKPSTAKLLFSVLAFFCLWLVVCGVYSIWAVKETVARNENQTLSTPQQPQKLETAVETSFFGEYIPLNLQNAGIKKSTLNLKIVGIIFSENEKQSQVIVQESGGKESIYHIGDKMPGGGVVKRIIPEGIVISRKGVLERLNLPQEKLKLLSPPKPLLQE